MTKNSLLYICFVAVLCVFAGCGNKSSQKENLSDSIQDTVANRKVSPNQYCNEKYGFCISFPEGYFVIKSENEDGAELVSNDNFAKIEVHKGNLLSTVTDGSRLREAYDSDLQPKGKREVTYNSFGATNYILMGYENKTIFYQKTIISKGVIATAVLYYEDEAKDTYYPMIQSIFKSFE